MQQKRIWSLYPLLPWGVLPACHWQKSEWKKLQVLVFFLSPCFDHRIMFSIVDAADAYTESNSAYQEGN